MALRETVTPARLVLTRVRAQTWRIGWSINDDKTKTTKTFISFGVSNNLFYYMASSASGQDELNHALWLATRAGKIAPSCPLGTTHCIPQVKWTKSYLIMFGQDGWILASVFFLRVFGPGPTSSRSINTQKKNLANIQPSWPLTWSTTHT